MARRSRLKSGSVRLLALAFAAACGGESAPPDANVQGATGGTVLIGLIGEPKTLLPPLSASEHEQAVMEVLHDRLAEIAPSLDVENDRGFTPRLASSWTWASDSMSIRFTLDARARWHDGRPVTSDDVALTYALYTNPEVGSYVANLLGNIDSVTTPDAATATFWFRRRTPQQFYDAVHHMFIVPAHLLRDIEPAELATSPLSRAPIGTGRFRFVRWSTDGRIELIADTANFRGRPTLDRVVYELFQQTGPALVRLASGETDFVAPLLAQSLPDVAASSTARLVRYPSLRYQLLTFNLRRQGSDRDPHPVLGDVRVRRALSMAANTERIVRAVYDTIGRVALGPIPSKARPAPDSLRAMPFDTLAAQALLDSAGWQPGPDGVRRRGNERLRIELLVPSTSESRQRIAVLLQDQWRAIGAEVTVQVSEVEALVDRISNGRFDAVTNGWTLSPGLVGLRQVWRTNAVESNYGRYANATVDAMVDSLLDTFDAAQRADLIRRVAQAVVDDAPAIWLVEDEVLAGVHNRLEVGTPSPLGWWSDLASWSVKPGQQLPRDQLGLPPAR